MTTHHTSGAADLPVITSKDCQFLHDNPNTDDLVAWVQDYAARAVALAAGQAVAPAESYAELEKKHSDFVETVGLMLEAVGYTEDYARQWPKEKASITFKRWFDEQLATRPAPPAMDGGEDAERWEFRWLNPANQQNVAPSELAWKTVNSKGMRSEKEVLEDLKTYRYQGKPVYELRPLFTTRALQKPEIRCSVRLANGGDCPRHNLQCEWPDCNKETK